MNHRQLPQIPEAVPTARSPRGCLGALRGLGLGFLLLILAAAALLLSDRPNPASAPSPHAQLAYVAYSDNPLNEQTLVGVREGFAEAGWTEGEDYSLRLYNAQSDLGTLAQILDEVRQNPPDLLLTSGTPALQAALQRIQGIPMVFGNVAYPLVTGVGESFQRHRPDITGISVAPDFEGTIDLLLRLLPRLHRIGTLFSPGEINAVASIEEFQRISQNHGLELITVPVNSSSEVADAALALTSQGLDAIVQIVDNLTSGSMVSILQAARMSRTPIFAFQTDPVEKGAIAARARDYDRGGRDMTRLALKVLRGVSPGDLPIELVSETLLLFNLDAAGEFGLTIPGDLLAQADKVIGKRASP
ncbi:MAG: ABC transporter substrate-binding protein [bacterium]